MILGKRTKGRKRRGCEGKKEGNQEKKEKKKEEGGRGKKNQAAEELDLLSPLAPRLVFLDSGVFHSLFWNSVSGSVGIREEREENPRDLSFLHRCCTAQEVPTPY